MTAMEIPQWITLPELTRRAVSGVSLPDPVPSFEDFKNDPALLLPYAGEENGLVILRLFLEWIPALRAQYRAMGIPEAIFRDNLTDISIWAEDYWAKHHRPGFAEWEWVSNSIRMKVFRLGRLQFEPRVLTKAITFGSQDYPAGTPVLEVHIPAGEPLEDTAVAESLQHAPDFFRTFFHQEFCLFHCHSWLLSPQLHHLLPPGSRILQFQNRFAVYAEDRQRQAEERVFGYLSETPSCYPENTTLQRTLKKALTDGLSVGMGMGIRKIP